MDVKNVANIKYQFHHFNFKELISDIRDSKRIHCSFELVFCNDDEIYKKFISDVMKYSPLFYTLTWPKNNNQNADGHLKFLMNITKFPKNTLIHLAARGMKQETIVQILDQFVELNIRNLFIISGDGNCDNGDFNYSIDLIIFITERYDDKFYIGVAGYPSCHPDSISNKQIDLYYLKKKIDAGASFIITQVIFDSKNFLNFINDCRRYGIDVPIIPFFMPIISYESFIKMTKNCNLSVPQSIYDNVEQFKDDAKYLQQYGRKLIFKMIKDIILNGDTFIIHICTLNNARITVELCESIQTLFTI